MQRSGGELTAGSALAVVAFEYVRATPRIALARLQAEVLTAPPAGGSAPGLLVIADRAHRLRPLPDPAGWLFEEAGALHCRVAWPVPLHLVRDREAHFLAELPGAEMLTLPEPVHRRLTEPAELVRWAPGGRLGLVTALMVCGVVAAGAGAPDAHAREIVIPGPNGPIVVTEDCVPDGVLPDGRLCVLPECPPPPDSDGTPCLPALQASPGGDRESPPATGAAQAEPEPDPGPEPAPQSPGPDDQAAEPDPQPEKTEPGSEPGGPATGRERPDEPAAGAPKRSSKDGKRPDRGRRDGARPGAEAPVRSERRPAARQEFRQERRQAAERRRAAVERLQAAERRADQAEERKTAHLRKLARTIDRAQDSPLTGGIVLPGLAMPDPPEPPGFLKPIYKEAGSKHGIPWQVLASINEIETQYGRLLGPSPAGAVGWMQFMPATWKAYGVDADGDGVKDPDNPRDAIFAAARYLEAAGAREDLPRAIFAYNHADWYVQAVLLRAREMRWRDPEVTKLLRMRRWQLERRVLRDERIEIYGCGREDIRLHRIDRRVLLVLRFLADNGLHPTVTSLDCGHSLLTKSGNISHHSHGGAVDITAINGTPILGNQGPGSVTEAAIRRLLTLRGIMAPDEIISLIEVNGAESAFAMADHADHIHIGFRPRRDVRAKRERLQRQRAERRFAELERHPEGMFRRLI